MTDPLDIINDFHKRKEHKPRLCKKCKGEMKKTGHRTATSVNYLVLTCQKCGAEETILLGIDQEAKDIIKKNQV